MDLLAISPYTKLFWIEYQLNPNRSDYNIVFDQTITGPLDTSKLDQALKKFIGNNILFNSHLVSERNGDLYWGRNEEIIPIAQISKSKDIQIFTEKPFNLETGPLYRFGLHQINKEQYDFIIVLHHILIDGNDFNQFIDEISFYYKGFTKINTNQQLEIEKLNQTLNDNLSTLYSSEILKYWSDFLSGLNEENCLPYINNNLFPEKEISEYSFKISNSEFSNWKNSKQYHHEFNLLMIVWGSLISRFNLNNDMFIKYPISIKEGQGLKYGAQINSLIFPIKEIHNNSLLDYYDYCNKHVDIVKESFPNDFGYLPTSDILENTNIKNLNLSFAQTGLKNKKLEFYGCETEVNHRFNLEIAGADLSLCYETSDSNLNFRLLYKTNLFTKHQIASICSNYVELLKLSLFIPEVAFDEHKLIKPKFFFQAKDDIRNSEKAHNIAPIHYKFMTISKLYYKNTALIYEKINFSYHSLNEESNRLARYIYKIYTDELELNTTNALIPIYLERSVEMFISIIAILKSGAAYVPINTNYPKEKIKYILKDTNAKLILTQTSLIEQLQHIGDYRTLDLDKKEYQNEASDNIFINSSTNDYAYVIYTSGTTGYPKGVIHTHHNLMTLFSSIDKLFEFTNDDNWIMCHSYAFDFSIWEIFGALLYGGTLVIPTKVQVMSPDELYHLCIKNNITVLNQTPYSFYNLVRILPSQPHALKELRYIILGGDKINQKQLNSWWTYLDKNKLYTKLINMYGTTETTIHATYKILSPSDIGSSNIGTALPHLHFYILDQKLNPVPIGAVGELYLGGSTLSLGYLNKPNITNHQFVESPFHRYESTLYRTGDLVKVLDSTQLDYLGRNDNQIKLRGYRIELEEIENTMLALQNVSQAHVMLQQSGNSCNQRLLAFYVGNSQSSANSESISLENWREIYEDEYQNTSSVLLLNGDFRGWKSYISGKPIPLMQMEQWRNATLSLIKNYSLNNVLEIGIGTGLIMYPLLDYVNTYDGIDISNNIVQQHLSIIKDHKNYYKKLSIRCARADEINNLWPAKEYSCIILNSVVQYFPNIEYLKSVITELLNKLEHDGVICIGDIRDYRLLKDILIAKEQYHNSNYTNKKIEQKSAREPELLLSPEFFIDLANNHENIKVDILEKEGEYCNELNTYRYDAVIRKSSKPEVIHRKYLKKIEFKSIDSLVDNLEFMETNEIFYINSFLNTRLASNENLNLKVISKNIANRNLILKVIHFSPLGTEHLTLAISKSEFFTTDIYSYPDKSLQNYNIPQAVSINSESVKEKLLLKLPEYMVPSRIIKLYSFPLTVNGKLDEKLLLDSYTSEEIDNYYIPPENYIQERMCNIWENILQIGKIGVECNFFHMGGHSLLALQAVNKFNDEFNSNLKISDVFKDKTIKNLYKTLGKSKSNRIIPVKDAQLLSFSQESLWFIEQYSGGTNAYHIPLLFIINQRSCSVNILKKTLNTIVKKHEVLRTVISTYDNGISYQKVKTQPIDFIEKDFFDIKNMKEQVKLDINMPFDLKNSYPIRIALYYLKSDDGNVTNIYVLVNFHHIAFDGWSVKIFLTEMVDFCDMFKHNKKANYSLPLQYKDYSAWQRSCLKDNNLQELICYWKHQLRNYQALKFPTNYIRPSELDYRGNSLSFNVDIKMTKQLKNLASSCECTLYNILLSAFYILLYKYTNQKDLIIGTPFTNRPSKNFSELIGFFVNSLPIRVQLTPTDSAKDLIKQVANITTEASEHSGLPLSNIVETLEIDHDFSRHPIFQILFSLQSFDVISENEYFKTINIDEELDYAVSKFDFDIIISDHNSFLTGKINYSINLFNREMIVQMINSYELILSQLTKCQNKSIKDFKVTERLIGSIVHFSTNKINKQTDKTEPNISGIMNLEIQDKILLCWKKVLPKNNFSINDNFFDVGGNSIKIVELNELLQKSFGITELTIIDLFRYPTIVKFAKFLHKKYRI